MGDLDLATRHTLHHNAQIIHDSQVLPVSEIQGVNAQTRRGKSLFQSPEGKGEGGKEKKTASKGGRKGGGRA